MCSPDSCPTTGRRDSHHRMASSISSLKQFRLPASLLCQCLHTTVTVLVLLHLQGITTADASVAKLPQRPNSHSKPNSGIRIKSSGGTVPKGSQLGYQNGSVFDVPITVNLVFYGDWFDTSSEGKQEKARLEKFVTSLSDTSGGTIKDWWKALNKLYVGTASGGGVSTKVIPKHTLRMSRSLSSPTCLTHTVMA